MAQGQTNFFRVPVGKTDEGAFTAEEVTRLGVEAENKTRNA